MVDSPIFFSHFASRLIIHKKQEGDAQGAPICGTKAAPSLTA
jgi:hypothetical protein